MPDLEIIDLPAANSIDGATDEFPIYDSSDAQVERITRNTFLGISSDPVGRTDTQTLTNKTLTSPTITGPTFSGTLIGTYTIGGTPTFPSAVATLTGSQTLTNKTLTSPTINTPTITNPTLTVDTISEHSAANGVTIDSLSIKDGKLVTADSVVAANITDGIIENAHLNTTEGEVGGAWATWSPSYTNIVVGDGTVVAKYTQIGKTVHFRFALLLGSTSSVSNDHNFSLPVTPHADYNTHNAIGTAIARDASGAVEVPGVAQWIAGAVNRVEVRWSDTGGSALSSSTYPFTEASGDILSVSGSYEAA